MQTLNRHFRALLDSLADADVEQLRVTRDGFAGARPVRGVTDPAKLARRAELPELVRRLDVMIAERSA